MRDHTTLPYTYTFVGKLWDPTKRVGNYDNNRVTVDTIVLHSMDGTLPGTTAWFQRQNGITSAHYGIGFSGEIVQWLPESVVAYHANNYPINQRSIGIEHEDNANNQIVRPDALYETSAKLVAEICIAYSIPLDRQHVMKHNEISNTACPGTLDVDRIVRRAKELLTPPASADEQPVSHMLKPSVFAGLVTQSTEYDVVWAALGLDPSLKTNPGSSKLILDLFESMKKNNAVSVAPAAPVVEAPVKQSVTMWRTDVRDILKDILGAIRGNRTS